VQSAIFCASKLAGRRSHLLQERCSGAHCRDSQIASGSPGLLVSGNVATEKNWSGGNLRPLGHLDVEQDWAKPQHFTQGVTFGTETFTASLRAEQNTFLPGALTATWTGATRTTDKAVTITRVQVQAKTAPAGCTTNAIVRLTDGTTPVNVTISAAGQRQRRNFTKLCGGCIVASTPCNGRSGLYHQPRRRQRHRPVPHAIRLGEGKRTTCVEEAAN